MVVEIVSEQVQIFIFALFNYIQNSTVFRLP